MDKFVATIVIIGLVIVVFLGVFQGGLASSISSQNSTVTTGSQGLNAITPTSGALGSTTAK